MTYSVTPQDYLSRAKDCLLSNNPAALFYAAQELRCCVESRQADYLDALEFYTGKKHKSWRVGDTSRKLLRTWNDPKITRLTFRFPDREFPTFFTPVMPKLARAVERDLGALLHAQLKYRSDDDPWWSKTRSSLMEIYRQAWIACRGEHMAPPLWKPKSRTAHPWRLYTRAGSEELIVRLLLMTATKKIFSFEVEYLDSPPSDWRCDL